LRFQEIKVNAMSDSDRTLLRTIQAEREIKKALLAFCRGADRRDYDLLRSAFHDDAHDDHGAYAGDVNGFIAWQKVRHANIPQCMHMLGNCTIEFAGEKAYVETYCTATIHTANEDGSFTKAVIGCRYADIFEDRGSSWRIARRIVVYDWATSERVEKILPMPNLSASQRSEQDVIYRMRRLPAAIT
jgi:hypothetical protein